ncbi:Protein of unknown function [Lactobacillus equicursoris 66c]|uniref:Bacteriocin-type signal sequence n=1 Tax=Lactobacillus equicursoris 66c TaxID=872326 RepID=K0NDW4_9LACO|nr:Protein of unknown function [Lactobacillus equicursoris 66c]
MKKLDKTELQKIIGGTTQSQFSTYITTSFINVRGFNTDKKRSQLYKNLFKVFRK